MQDLTPVFRTLRMARFVALTVLCLVVATATAQAHTQSAFKLTIKPAVTTFTTAKFVVITSVATRLTIATGTDKNNLMPTPDRLKFRHVVTVRGLAPNTNYYALVTATSNAGKAAKTWRTFKTAGPGSAPATVTSRGNKLLLNGQPFFPIMGFTYSCPDQEFVRSVSTLRASVIAFYGGEGCGGGPSLSLRERVQNMHIVLNGRLWWMEFLRPEDPPGRQVLQGLPELLGWTTPPIVDAPEGWTFLAFNCSSTSRLYKSLSSTAKSHVLVHDLNLARFPIKPDVNSCLTPTGLKAEFWAVVVARGAGVKYSTTNAGNASPFDVRLDILTQAAKQSQQMATLGPCILTGKPVAVKSDPKSPLRFGAWRYGESTCIVAVNTKNAATNGKFGIDGLVRAKTAQVMWEGRSVKVTSGSISDTFAPLAVHIYKVGPGSGLASQQFSPSIRDR